MITQTENTVRLGEFSRRLPTLVLLALVPLAVSLVAVSAPTPMAWAPYPAISLLLIFAGLPKWGTILVAPVVFIFIAEHSIRSRAKNPLIWLSIVMGLLTAMDAGYFVLRFSQGLEHQGVLYCSVMVMGNIAAAIGFWMCWSRCRVTRSVAMTYFMSLIVSCWLFGLAFPYFGEGI